MFDTEKSIISYENLGIARLIYQLPTTLCDMFLKEVFKRGSIDSLDQETLFTIQKFFENNLNVSETSRKLFVHRNTLVYRLEKIKKLTGLDLREFDDAIVFKVALMVNKYLDSSPINGICGTFWCRFFCLDKSGPILVDRIGVFRPNFNNSVTSFTK